MWEIATLGNIPTSTYFVACVAFSLARDGGHRTVRFCPILLVRPSVALPNSYNRSVPSSFLGFIWLKRCLVKQTRKWSVQRFYLKLYFLIAL